MSDNWIPTVCYMCFNCCGIEVRHEHGVVVEIRGDPDNPHNQGKLCAKGKAAIMSLYNPGRLAVPLKRTNPAKGIGVDPGWQEIGWEEAWEEVVSRLRKVRAEDPRKLIIARGDFHVLAQTAAFAAAFGTPNNAWNAASYFCGNALHPVSYLTSGSFYVEPDLDYCNYLILMGSQLGFMIDTSAVLMAKKMAEARARGMKVVVVDPLCNQAASKADEWVPIRPGTDAALALGILNLLLNELKIYDQEFIRRKTNGPYLIGPQGYYVRDEGTGKPLVWDRARSQGVPYDSLDWEAMDLEGEHELGGELCLPSFRMLKEHVKTYSLKKVSEITTVPAATIERMASEFGQGARIGSKIVIQGKELPFRPVAVQFSRGAAAHRHGMLTGLAIALLNLVVGAVDVPGGILGVNPVSEHWRPKEDPDGLLVPAEALAVARLPYPGEAPGPPRSVELIELFPVAPWARTMYPLGVRHPEKFGLPYKPEVLLHARTNLMLGTTNPEELAEALKKIPFIISFAREIDETVEFADIVIPDAHALERLDPFPNLIVEWIAAGLGSWYWEMRQPVARPPEGVEHWAAFLVNLADRLGFRADFYALLNAMFEFKEPCRLDPNRRHSWEEMADLWAKSRFGPARGLEWFKQEGFLISGRKEVEEAYPSLFVQARVPLYLEHLKRAGKALQEVIENLGLSWDTSDYQPLPDWKPCPAFKEEVEGDSLYAVNYKLPFHTFSYTMENPWLSELAEHHASALKILLSPQAARKREIKEGDTVWIESAAGRVKGKVKLSQAAHPEVVGIAGTFGHWAQGLPVSRGKGVHFNRLLSSDLERIDMVSSALDACVRVRVSKA